MTSELTMLRAQLAEEQDRSRRNAILRAMCDSQDDTAAVQFIRELDGSAVQRALNRGYYLRLYDASSGPATEFFRDVGRATDWSVARSRFLGQARQRACGEDVRPLRSALDLYTFFDFCVSRAEQVYGRDAMMLNDLVDATWRKRAIPAEIADRLLGLAAICASQSQILRF